MLQKLCHTASVCCISVDWTSNLVVSGGFDGILRLWDVDTAVLLRKLVGHTDVVSCLSVDWAAMQALSASYDGSLRTWDLACEGSSELVGSCSGPVRSLKVDWRSMRALCACGEEALEVWDLRTQGIVQQLAGHSGPVTSVSVDWISGLVLSGSWDTTMKLWDLDQRGGVLHEQGRVVIGLAASSKSASFARARDNQASHLLPVQGADLVGDIVGSNGAIFSVAADWFHEFTLGSLTPMATTPSVSSGLVVSEVFTSGGPLGRLQH